MSASLNETRAEPAELASRKGRKKKPPRRKAVAQPDVSLTPPETATSVATALCTRLESHCVLGTSKAKVHSRKLAPAPPDYPLAGLKDRRIAKAVQITRASNEDASISSYNGSPQVSSPILPLVLSRSHTHTDTLCLSHSLYLTHPLPHSYIHQVNQLLLSGPEEDSG